MDDLFEGLAGFVAVLVLIALAIYLIVLAIPFILYGFAVYHGGRKFGRQLRDYELGGAGWLVLFGLGGVSIVVATAPALTGDSHPIVILLAVPLFLGLAVSALGAWAFARQQPYRAQVRALDAEGREAEDRAREIDDEVSQLAARARALEGEHTATRAQRGELLALVERLCETDAQVWGVRRRRWEAELGTLGPRELAWSLRDARQRLGEPATPEAAEVGPAIRGCLLRAEELQRRLGEPDEELARLRGTLETRVRAREEARAQAEARRLERERAAAALEAFRSSRVRLG